MNPRYVAARSLADALAALRDAGPNSRVLAGGTDLMVEVQSGRTRPERVVDVWRVAALRGIAANDGELRLGALTTCRELGASAAVRAHAPILAAAAVLVGGAQIQNRATLGGNLGTASPAADLTPALLALDARVVLRDTAGTRALPLAQFLTGYRATARRPGELIEAVLVPKPHPDRRSAFRKVGTRKAQSISKVVVAITLVGSSERVIAVRAAAGSVADRTIELPALARELVGHAPTPERIAAAARAAADLDARPIDDVRSTAVYRREALRRVTRTLLAELLAGPTQRGTG